MTYASLMQKGLGLTELGSPSGYFDISFSGLKRMMFKTV